MRRWRLTSLAVVAVGSMVLAPEVLAGPVAGNLSSTGIPRADGGPVQIEVTCLAEPTTPAKPAKPVEADKPEKPEKPTKSEKPAKPETPARSYKASAKIPGSYSVNVEEQGDCSLTVRYQGMTATIPILSEKGSVRYDLVLSIVDGKLRLRRQ
jgi:hypothetical protein